MKTHVVKTYYTEALFELLKKKEYREITIVDLVNKSGASRASFYRNYISKDQIVDEYCEQVIGSIFERHPISAVNIRSQVRGIFEQIYGQRSKLRLLRNADLLDRMDRCVFGETLNQINRNEVLNNRYQPYFFAGAASALIKAWVKYDFEESPEEMTEIFLGSLSGYMEIRQEQKGKENTV